MKIFKKKTAQTSNDYYEAYKAELSGNTKVEKNRFFSLSKVFKFEVLVLALGLFILNQNGLSLELKKMYVAGNDILPVSIQSASVNDELVVTLSQNNFKKIEIREENEVNTIEEKETYVENDDIKLLIELLNAEFDNNKNVVSQNRIVISQK